MVGGRLGGCPLALVHALDWMLPFHHPNVLQSHYQVNHLKGRTDGRECLVVDGRSQQGVGASRGGSMVYNKQDVEAPEWNTEELDVYRQPIGVVVPMMAAPDGPQMWDGRRDS